MVLSLGLGLLLQTLPVGETGGSKGKGADRGGGSPARRAAARRVCTSKARKTGDTPVGGGPKARAPFRARGAEPHSKMRPNGRHSRKPCKAAALRHWRREMPPPRHGIEAVRPGRARCAGRPGSRKPGPAGGRQTSHRHKVIQADSWTRLSRSLLPCKYCVDVIYWLRWFGASNNTANLRSGYEQSGCNSI